MLTQVQEKCEESKVKVLIVDDEASIRMVIRRSLSKLMSQVEIYEAGDGVQAERMANEVSPNMIILDLMLPCKNGLDVCNTIRGNPNLNSTMIFGITGYNSPENIKTLMERGAVDCLMKPFGLEELKKMLDCYWRRGICRIKNENADRKDSGENKIYEILKKLFCFLTFFSSVSQLNAAENEKQFVSVRNYEEQIPDKKEKISPVRKVAVAPFKSFNYSIDGKSFSDTLVERLIKKIPQLTVVERPDIEKVLSEQRFSLTGAVKGENTKNLGKIEPVDALVMGTIRTLERFDGDGGAIVVNVKIVNVINGQIIWSHKEETRYYFNGIDTDELVEILTNRSVDRIIRRIKSDEFAKYLSENDDRS